MTITNYEPDDIGLVLDDYVFAQAHLLATIHLEAVSIAWIYQRHLVLLMQALCPNPYRIPNFCRYMATKDR